MCDQSSKSQMLQSSIINSFKSNLISVNGEIIENFADFLDTITLKKSSKEKAIIIQTREFETSTRGFNADELLHELRYREFEVLFADELFKDGNYRETVFEKCVLSVTFPILGIADTGTIVECNPIRSISLLSPVHLAILNRENIVTDMKSALDKLASLYTSETNEIVLPPAITFITGPSRTADIEQTLTVGVHGPIRQAVFIV